MVVIHRQQQESHYEGTPQHRCEQCIGVDRNPEELEDPVANGGIGKDEQQVHEGQLQPSGTLISPENIKCEGRVTVRVKFEEDISRVRIVPGSTGNVAIYSHHMHHLGVMRKVLLRMKSWMNHVF